MHANRTTALAMLTAAVIGCGGGGSGSTIHPHNNPSPTVSSISPSSATEKQPLPRPSRLMAPISCQLQQSLQRIGTFRILCQLNSTYDLGERK